MDMRASPKHGAESLLNWLSSDTTLRAHCKDPSKILRWLEANRVLQSVTNCSIGSSTLHSEGG
eukprot:scaffold7114_cov264-Pinguiococcus_pyrenoidosus.AAC.2